MIQIIVNSILLGGIYALVASGFSLVWGVMNIINMTHGSIMMLGAYSTFFLWKIGIDPLISIPISMLIMFVFGYALQKKIINRIINAPMWMTLVITFGLDLFIVNIAILFFSATPRSVVVGYGSLSINIWGISLPLIKLLAFIPALLIIFALYSFVGKTKMGRAIQATRMDPGIAEVMGIEIEKIYAITFGLGACLAAAAGSILSIYSSITPNMGMHYTAIAFIICVLGGLGNIKAVIPAGILLGFIEGFGSFYIGTSYERAIAYASLLIILTFIPSGLFGKQYY
jgi:branched-chain amino acid transport system permease protein